MELKEEEEEEEKEEKEEEEEEAVEGPNFAITHIRFRAISLHSLSENKRRAILMIELRIRLGI